MLAFRGGDLRIVRIGTPGQRLSRGVARQIDNDFSTVESSEDGLSYITLDAIDSDGTLAEAKSFTYTDPTLLAATRYYRIKQTDFDGRFSYGNVAVVEKTAGTSAARQIELRLSPNPVSTELHIAGLPNVPVGYEIYSVTGQRVGLGEFVGSAARVAVDVLPQGVYVLRARTSAGKLGVGRFVKE